jgi:hypothetical protein
MKKIFYPVMLSLSFNSFAAYECLLTTKDTVLVKTIEYKGSLDLNSEIPAEFITKETIFNPDLTDKITSQNQNGNYQNGEILSKRNYIASIKTTQKIQITDNCGPSAPGGCNLNLKFKNVMGREVETIFGTFIIASEDNFNDVNIDTLIFAQINQDDHLQITNSITKSFNDQFHSSVSEIIIDKNSHFFSIGSSTGQNEMQIWSDLECKKI